MSNVTVELESSQIKKYDLHMHTLYSDGVLSPFELIDRAKSRGLAGISITDHDSIDAYIEAKDYAMSLDLAFMPGIELSSELNGQTVHILGYGFNPLHPAISAYCQRQEEWRVERLNKILYKLSQRNMPLELEDVKKFATSKIIGRMHIAQAMLDKLYVHSVSAAFEQYIGDQKSCYVSLQASSVLDAIHAIQAAGGKAVLAHPHMMKLKLVKKVLELKALDGLEVYYANLTQDKELPFLQLAQTYELIPTGGSDFHFPSPYRDLGCSFVLEKTYQKILSPQHMLMDTI